MNGDITVPRHPVEPGQDLSGPYFVRDWNRILHEISGTIEKQAVGFAVGTESHLTADRHFRFFAYAEFIERHLIYPDDEGMQALQHHRMVGYRL